IPLYSILTREEFNPLQFPSIQT
ncbi:hypothetical protein Zm00014a_005316, partial [Zea mays]